MRYFLALLPILLVLVLMIRFGAGVHQAGAAGLAAGVIISLLWFGLTPEVFWVSQAKALLLSLFVLGVMWPALFLYHWIDQNGGIEALSKLLQSAAPDRGMCLVLMAWSLSGALEGIAGFGLPIAVVAPMLVTLGVAPLRAVAAVAIGHSWAVTFGDMGVILQTLGAVVDIPVSNLVPCAAILLGFACLLCGLGAALILGEIRHWPKIGMLSVVIALTQYGLAAADLVPLSAFGAGVCGLAVYLIIARARFGCKPATLPAEADRSSCGIQTQNPEMQTRTRPVLLALGCYGGLMILLALVSLVNPLRQQLQSVEWKGRFPAVSTSAGFSTAASPGQIFRPLVHPGTLILLVALTSVALEIKSPKASERARRAAQATVRSAGITSLGVIIMVGLSTLMDHCGMSLLLAQGLSAGLGGAYPLLSPAVGMLGAFATGSNNNSNVLFGSMQKNVAVLLHLRPEVLIASQTAGGSLGSMLAPAKIIVGCSTVAQVGREGQVLRQTVPFGLGAGLVVGVLTFILSRLR